MANTPYNIQVKHVLSRLHKANFSWQSRVGRLQNVGKLVPSHVKLNNANLQYGRRSARGSVACVLVLFRLITRQETENSGEI